MTSTHRLKRHAALVDDMAEARGIDLQDASLRAGLTPDDLADMVHRCAGCTQPDSCESWLASQVGAVSETPEFCRNAKVFDTLARLGSG
ncbi:DUF6455 family protein [uncultured Tateyamaria sp.]|uniref:DUF6455 family protein n=1 Tax=Tateyamaria sp. 1078 TaxID=3417464 RepID=UPI00260E6175|nr:DUF6455 family protein [uncultured Tateyamaria sp.]